MFDWLDPNLLIAVACILVATTVILAIKDKKIESRFTGIGATLALVAILIQHVDTVRDKSNEASNAAPTATVLPTPSISTESSTKPSRKASAHAKPSHSPSAEKIPQQAEDTSTPPDDLTGTADPQSMSLFDDAPPQDNPLTVEEACKLLGYDMEGKYAWLPGQTSAYSYDGRQVEAKGAAYTWSCTQDGPKLTQVDLSRACPKWYPNTTAYATDPDNAYSWVCRESGNS